MSSYTPFIEKSVDKIVDARNQAAQRDLSQSAYMGDEQALSELFGMNPQLADQIRMRKMQEQQMQLSQQASQQQMQQKRQDLIQKRIEDAKSRMAKMDFENAKVFGQQVASELGIRAPELTPEAHTIIRQGYGGVQTTDQKTANVQDFEYYQELKDKDSEGATMFAKDVGLIPRDKQMSATGEKALIESQNRFYDLTTQSREYELLANDFDRFRGSLPSGTAGTFSEFVKSVTGSQDEATELRRRFNKVRLSEALKYLPPGPATDRDVQEAFKGVPKDNASPEQVKMFLRGAAKMSAIEAEFQEFKSNYISEKDSTKGLTKAWKEAIKNNEVESINQIGQEPEVSDEELFSKYGI